MATDRRRLSAAMDRLRHRGPDDEGTCEQTGILLGHRRLSILDLTAAGRQPMASDDGRLLVVFNGEIYNYIELRAELARAGHVFRTGTDTEVLLAAADEWGAACLKRFRGMFAFALWDTRSRRLVLARDRIGERPLYYWRDGERFAFASELKALLELIPTRPSLSPESVNTYLHYQYVIEPATMLDGVRKLPAAHFLEIGADQWDAAPERYWDIHSVPAAEGEPMRQVRDALESAVELTLRSDAPVGVALSGGIDSGVIASLASRTRPDVAAFTIGYPGQHHFDERSQAGELARLLKIRWHSAELTTDAFVAFFPDLVYRMDEPIADMAAYGHYAVSRLAADHGVKVLLTGIGGDELFFGYHWVREALRLSRLKLKTLQAGSAWGRVRAAGLKRVLDVPAILNVAANRRLPAWWRARVERAFDDGRLDLEHPDEWVFYQLDYHWRPGRLFSEQVYADDFKRRLAPRSAYGLMQGLGRGTSDPQVAICGLLFDSWLVSNCLALGDRVSLASAVESRVPLLDVALIETVVGFWNAGRTEDSHGYKLWLRQIAQDVLPAEVLARPKLGFVTPTVEWMTAVNARYRSHVLDGTLIESGVLDGDRVRRWLDRTPAGVHRDFFQYKLTLLEVWHRLIVKGDKLTNS